MKSADAAPREWWIGVDSTGFARWLSAHETFQPIGAYECVEKVNVVEKSALTAVTKERDQLKYWESIFKGWEQALDRSGKKVHADLVKDLLVERDSARAQVERLTSIITIANAQHDKGNLIRMVHDERSRAERAEADLTRTKAFYVLQIDKTAAAEARVRALEAELRETRLTYYEVVEQRNQFAARAKELEER